MDQRRAPAERPPRRRPEARARERGAGSRVADASSAAPAQVNRNYAFVLCVWDHLFGSFEPVVVPARGRGRIK